MSSLEELSDQLIEIIKSKDDPLNDVIEFLNVQGEKAREIINKMGKNSKKTPLMEACSQSKESIVKLFLTSGADPNISYNNDNHTALLYTINKNEIKVSDLSIIKMLSEYGANLNFRYCGLSPLEYASFPIYNHSRVTRSKAYELVELLIQLGADVNTKDKEGKTPLMRTLKGLDKVVPLLIKAGANVDAQDIQGETALMKFVRESDQMVNFLLDAKANVFIKDLDGLTAVEHYQPHDLDWRWSTPNKDFIPRLTKAYLEPLCLYFKESSYQQIQNDVGEFLKSVNDDKSFPIKAYQFSDDLSYLVYFGTADFEEKVYADILNRINEDNQQTNSARKFNSIARYCINLLFFFLINIYKDTYYGLNKFKIKFLFQ